MSLSLVMGTMIGGGIFLLPSTLAPLGWNAVIGWLLSGAGIICMTLIFRFLLDGSGQGLQHNIERVLGEMPAFIGLWAYWLAGFTSIASLCIAGAALIVELIAPGSGTFIELTLATGLVWCLVVVNISGTRSAGSFQTFSVAIKLIPLLAVIILAAGALISSEPLQPLAPTTVGLETISTAVALTVFALLGFEASTLPVGKITNPGRTIAISMLGGTSLVLALYLLSSTAIVMLTPWEQVAASTSPFTDAIAAIVGPWTAVVVTICIIVSVVGCSNGLLLVNGEIAYSMGLRSELPSAFKKVSSRGLAPMGYIATGIGTTILIWFNASRGLTGMFTFFVLLTSAGVIVLYFVGLFASLKESASVIRLPIFVGGLAFLSLATYGTGLESMLWVSAVIALGLVVRWLSRNAAVPLEPRPDSAS